MLPQMIADLKCEINDLRQLEHFLQSDEFRKVYESATDKTELNYEIKLRNIKALRRYVETHRTLDDKTIKDLRRIAAGLRIKDYHLHTKAFLIEEIQRCRMTEVSLQASKSFMNV